MLIESGPLAGPDADRALVRLNFVALVTALDGLASGRTAAHPTAAYDTLPVNESNLLSLRVRNATIAAGTGVAPFVGDIGVNTRERWPAATVPGASTCRRASPTSAT